MKKIKSKKVKTVKRNSSEPKNIFTKDDYGILLFLHYTLDDILIASKKGEYDKIKFNNLPYRIKHFKLTLTDKEINKLEKANNVLKKITNLKHTITVK